jgi:hypothetical protein
MVVKADKLKLSLLHLPGNVCIAVIRKCFTKSMYRPPAIVSFHVDCE